MSSQSQTPAECDGDASNAPRTIQLAHGGGGELTAQLLEEVIFPALGDERRLRDLPDAAGLDVAAGRIAFTTDSYVVQPLEFPGGDIGKLAVCGTVNDLAVSGAAPLALSLSLVIQEGFEIARLGRLIASAGCAAREAGVAVVTGDTKVVERAACDGLIVNTAGVGQVHPSARLDARRAATGDVVVLSGPLGEHGLAVMGQRAGLGLTLDLASDVASLWPMAKLLLDELGEDVKFMRDPTRGGLSAVLVELSRACGCGIELREADLPVNRTAASAAAILGLDLLSVANEGKLVAVVAQRSAAKAVELMRQFEIGRLAAAVGLVSLAGEDGLVELLTRAGGRRVVQMPYGEELPRIC